MEHIICGICNSDLSKPFSCGKLIHEKINYNYYNGFDLHIKGHFDGNIFSMFSHFIRDEFGKSFISFNAHEICCSCGRSILESGLIRSCRISLDEVPLVISETFSPISNILKCRLEHSIEPVIPLSIGKLDYEQYKKLKFFIIDHLNNRHIFETLDKKSLTQSFFRM